MGFSPLADFDETSCSLLYFRYMGASDSEFP